MSAKSLAPILAGVMLALACWELASRHFSGLAVAAPLATMTALGDLLSRPEFLLDHLAVTLQRTLAGLALGLFLGIFCGGLAGAFPILRPLFAPFRWALMSVPGVVVVMLGMLWLGMGTRMVAGIVALMTTPIIYVSVVEGLIAVDRQLLEMARVYRLTLTMRLVEIYGRALAGSLLAGATVALGGAMRVAVLAEALGANEGLGAALAVARTNLDTPQLYALALLSMGAAGLVELLMLAPTRKKLWRHHR